MMKPYKVVLFILLFALMLMCIVAVCTTALAKPIHRIDVQQYLLHNARCLVFEQYGRGDEEALRVFRARLGAPSNLGTDVIFEMGVAKGFIIATRAAYSNPNTTMKSVAIKYYEHAECSSLQDI